MLELYYDRLHVFAERDSPAVDPNTQTSISSLNTEEKKNIVVLYLYDVVYIIRNI